MSITLPAHLRVVPNESVEKLNTLEFDPIQHLVVLSRKIDKELKNLLYDKFGEPKERVSYIAYATLVGIQAKIANDLMRYGYTRVPEAAETKTATPDPIIINLNR